MPFAHCFPLGNLGEGDKAAEPNVVDPSPGLGDGDEQSITALGFHYPFFAWHMTDALHSGETWRGQGERQGVAGSRVVQSWVCNLRRYLACRIEADFQCLGFDDHARDVALDQLPVRK